MNAPIPISGVVLACNVTVPSAGSLTYYTIAAHIPNVGRVEMENQIPSTWRWPDTMDTNGPGMVGKIVSGYLYNASLYWDFVEPPHFKFCPGEEPQPLMMIDPVTGLPFIPGEPPPPTGGPSTPSSKGPPDITDPGGSTP